MDVFCMVCYTIVFCSCTRRIAKYCWFKKRIFVLYRRRHWYKFVHKKKIQKLLKMLVKFSSLCTVWLMKNFVAAVFWHPVESDTSLKCVLRMLCFYKSKSTWHFVETHSLVSFIDRNVDIDQFLSWSGSDTKNNRYYMSCSLKKF